MMKQKRPYKTYTREFKQEAVRLMETTDRPALLSQAPLPRWRNVTSRLNFTWRVK
jgi:hypothetical protein